MSDLNKNQQVKYQDEQPALDILQAGLFFLMTQYTFRQCPMIAAKIVEHLNMLCNHPQIELLPSQNHLFSKMINLWRARMTGSPEEGHSNSFLH